MKVKSQVLEFLHLDRSFSLLTVKNTRLILEYFNALDVHGLGKLNGEYVDRPLGPITRNERAVLCLMHLDIQFYQFMRHVTNLNKRQIFLVLDMLDQEATGCIQFKDFYLLMCIFIALKDQVEQQFMFRHLKLVFEMMDEDGGGTISAEEFGHFGFLFNLRDQSVRDIFFEFDVSGDEELDYKEFKMFAMACIDKQKELETKKRAKLLRNSDASHEVTDA